MRVEEIVRELNDLPKGYISRKKIKGKEYTYLQFLDGEKLKSRYLRENELEYYTSGIARRKELEAELRAVGAEGKTAPALSKRARELTGSLMAGDTEVARFEKCEMVYCDQKRAPLMLLRTRSLEAFLASRALDSSRTNSRLLKKALNIHGEPDEIVSLYAHGATITDSYWFKAKGSKLKYEDIRFDSDAYSEIALNGKVLVYNKRAKLSPQLTLGGSYEKCWKLLDGEWWMYKRGTKAEVFSELAASRIAELLGMPTAYYEAVQGDIRTRNFASEYIFEPMSAIAGEDDSMETVYEALRRFDNSMAMDYLKLLVFDAVVKNEDRHNENCGLMRNPDNGKIIGLAPNFDNNISLVARSEVLNKDPALDGLIQHFLKFVRGNDRAAEACREMKMQELREDDVVALVERCIEESGYDGVKADVVARFVVARFRYLQRMLG